jgi:hypothetical protein
MSEATTAQAILAICHQRGIVLGVAGQKLMVDAPQGAIESDLLDQFRQHKASLLDMLQGGRPGTGTAPLPAEPNDVIPPSADIAPWEECVKPPDPCPKCGSLMMWWDALGGQHCMMCEKPKYPPEKAAELRELAKRLRQFPRSAGYSRRGR